MQTFTVASKGASDSIAIAREPYPHIAVGEPGRGRKLARVALAASLADKLLSQVPCISRGQQDWRDHSSPCQYCHELTEARPNPSYAGVTSHYHPDAGMMERQNPKITEASVIRTAKGTLLVVEPRQGDYRALVLVDIEAGYRGGTTWESAFPVEMSCPKRDLSSMSGTPGEVCPVCKEKLIITDADIGRQIKKHPDSGLATVRRNWREAPPEGITVLAEGEKAQGIAGYMGGHMTRLIIMEPEASFRVQRHGRLYGAPDILYVRWTGEEMYVGRRDECWLPQDQPEEGELL